MKVKNFRPSFFIALFVIAQLILAPIAVGLLMVRGILLDSPRKKAALKHAEKVLKNSEEKLRPIFASK